MYRVRIYLAFGNILATISLNFTVQSAIIDISERTINPFIRIVAIAKDFRPLIIVPGILLSHLIIIS
ncbi:hypothetical protein [Paenibacillus sp. LHD-38]|uniref:hypothetical protein n=1 Tax=Paenibacillus sp. LHD-38 TaxID=3072143 RepID=UPI00280CE4F6|nr:hypothetical protein [Paenibacillus sp. LHD-38]MDQ8733260.1 hypothetical protein [Paenibacillus sp. LHD-38]